MVYLAFFIALILILPFVFSAYLYYDNKNKKLYLALYLFRYLNLISGYFTKRESGGFYFHISNKRVIILNKEVFNKLKDGPDFLPKLTVINSYSIIDSGVKDDVWLSFLFVFYTILRNFNCIISNKMAFLTLKTDLNLIDSQENLINIKLRITFCLNLLGILYQFFRSLILRGINDAKKQSKQAKRDFKREYK